MEDISDLKGEEEEGIKREKKKKTRGMSGKGGKKKREKVKERPQRSACYGHRKHKSFVESKHIFWKQGTDAKSLFS